MMRWRPYPNILMRVSDSTLWTPVGDCPYPWDGFNFVRLHKAKIGWWLDPNDRWLTSNQRLFNIVRV